MRVARLQTAGDAARAYPCLTEEPLRWQDGLEDARAWMAHNLGVLVDGFHLEDDNGNVIGHMYYGLSGRGLVPYQAEDGIVYEYCEWVQRQHRGKGFMRLLFDTAVEELRRAGYKGILVDASEIKEYMHHEHFAKRGFRVMQQAGPWQMYYPLNQDSVQAEPLEEHVPPRISDKVEVVMLACQFCPVMVSTQKQVRRIAAEFGDRVLVREFPGDRQTLLAFGRADGIYVNGKAKWIGPASDEEIRKGIGEELG